MTKQLSKPLKQVGKCVCDKELNNLCDKAGTRYIWQGHRERNALGTARKASQEGRSSSRLLSGSELEPGLDTGLLLQALQNIRLDREERFNGFGKQL